MLAVVLLLAGVAGALSLMAERMLAAQVDRLHATEACASRAIAVGRATANLLAFARTTEFLPIALPPEERRRREAVAVDAGVVGQVDQIAAAIAAAGEEQGAATQEIARNVAEATRGTEEVSVNITYVSSGMATTAAALQATTGQVTQQGHALRRELQRLRAA